MDLKGPTMRIGRFDNLFEISLRAGGEFRISTNCGILGDQNIVSCDKEDIHKCVSAGDKILLEYGRISFTVKKIETEQESLEALIKKFPEIYAKGFRKAKAKIMKGHVDSKILDDLSLSEDETESKQDTKHQDNGTESKIASSKTNGKEEQKHEDSLKKSPKKNVIVVNVDTNCALRPESAFFIDRVSKNSNDEVEKDKQETLQDKKDTEKEDLKDTWITPKDLEDLKTASKLDIDSVALSDIHTASDVKEYLRAAKGKKASFKIIAKIQNKDAVDNFAEIAKIVDGIMISRSYLAVHMPPEKFFFTQKQLISNCNRMKKPVFVIGQMLESMCTSIIPTTSEINDVSNLVLSCCDSIGLVKEMIWGKYPIESLKTLDRICVEAEQQMQGYDEEILEAVYTQHDNLKANLYQKAMSSISDAVVHCVLKAVYETKSPLVISFTQTGATALKLSKLPCPCPIIAVTSEEKIARQCSLLASVISYKVGSMMGTETLIPRVLKYAKDANLVQINDIVVICFGEVDGVPGITNSLKIAKVI